MSLWLFIVIAALASALLVLVLTRPLRPRGGSLAHLQRAHRLALRHLDRALRAGAIDAPLHTAQRRQLVSRLSNSLLAAGASPEPARPGARALSVAVAAGVALLVAGLYWYVGDPGALGPIPPSGTAVPSVAQMVQGLAQRLRARPDDLQGWTMLGRSYLVMGRYGDAADAYAQANRLATDDPDIEANYAEALVLTSPRALTGPAAPLIEQALARAPGNPQALWLGGLLAQARHDDALAARRWNTLLAQTGLPDDFRSAVQQHLQSLDQSSAAPAVLNPGPGSSPDGIDIQLSLAGALAARAPADATLFVFARAAQQSAGPPLAVRRLLVRSLPATLRLTSADAVMTGGSLNPHAALQLTARVTLHAGVSAQSGDLEGQAYYDGDGKPIRLVIDRVIP